MPQSCNMGCPKILQGFSLNGTALLGVFIQQQKKSTQAKVFFSRNCHFCQQLPPGPTYFESNFVDAAGYIKKTYNGLTYLLNFESVCESTIN